MNLKFLLTAAFVSMLSLTACGGGGGGSDGKDTTPATIIKTDTVIGTGAEAVAGKRAYVTYTGWLYDANKADRKGTQFDTGSFDFLIASGQVIKGFDQGVTGMKVGGKRTVQIPPSLGYGSSGNATIPPNSELIFDIELTDLK